MQTRISRCYVFLPREAVFLWTQKCFSTFDIRKLHHQISSGTLTKVSSTHWRVFPLWLMIKTFKCHGRLEWFQVSLISLGFQKQWKFFRNLTTKFQGKFCDRRNEREDVTMMYTIFIKALETCNQIICCYDLIVFKVKYWITFCSLNVWRSHISVMVPTC